MQPAPHRRSRPPGRRPSEIAACCLALAAAVLPLSAGTALASSPAPFAPDKVVVAYARPGSPTAQGATANATGGAEALATGRTHVLHLAHGDSVASALRRLRGRSNVAWAVPDYLAHAAGRLIPNDPGAAGVPGGWQQLQWNFAGEWGVNAPEAWANVAADRAAGGHGVTVAVLDTGVAYANRGPFRLSPDLARHQFVKGYDFVARDPFPNDRNGHGTFVASTIAEATNNGRGLTGLAFGARVMPVRVLDSLGEGEASTIAEGVVFAVRHGAQVINLSLEFSPGVTASDIPELIEALRYAHRRGVLVVAAAGNEGHTAIAFPAHAPAVVSVGATTEHGCLAVYSNEGSGLTIVAPGGGADASLPGDPNCHPELPPGRDIFQVTFAASSPRVFGIPSGYEGTSMAAPHVSATAALVIASGVLGRHPSPAQVTARLRATARRLGAPSDQALYGAGLLDAAAATAPGGPGAVPR
jgi:serine protease